MPTPTRVLFVTGKLAEPALRRVLGEHEFPFAWDVAVLKISVAALMTTDWIARHLAELPAGTDLVMIPGLCEGSIEQLGAALKVPVERGPKDLRDIPQHFGRAARAASYGAWQIEILAEINNAPKQGLDAIRSQARYYRESGADVIDIGCTPGLAFPALAEVVRALRQDGFRVSIDSFDEAEIATALEAGAEMVLSVNGTNLGVAQPWGGSDRRFVAIPDFGRGLDTLERTLEQLDRWNVRHLVDPVIEPIGFGFMASLERYAEVHRRWPLVPQFMGIGNITELTAADTTGVNALLIAICEEVGVRAVLTTEVIPWARGAVREVDIARRLMHYAVTEKTVPKRVDDRLVTIKDPRILAYSEDELQALQREVKDPNFRIFADGTTITVFNRDVFVRGTEIQEIFDQLGVDEPTHAFYLGKELARAKLAITLGKTYRQEGSLNWGYLTPPDDPRREHQKLTHRSQRSREANR
jgi:dihydropteroate synthase-like protein